MAVAIGKRKRQEGAENSDVNSEDEDAARALFQRAFEAKFKPLAHSESTVKKHEPDLSEQKQESDDESEWNGLSEDEEPVETVRHDNSQYTTQDARHERKAFMVG